MYRPCCFRRARTLAERGFRRRVGAAPTFARRPGFEDPTRWARRRRELLRAGFPAIGNGPSFPASARNGLRLSRSDATLRPRSSRIMNTSDIQSSFRESIALKRLLQSSRGRATHPACLREKPRYTAWGGRVAAKSAFYERKLPKNVTTS